MRLQKKIRKAIKSDSYFIYISTNEEERLEKTLTKINEELFKTYIYVWDFVEGYKKQPKYLNACKQNPLEALIAIEKYENIKANLFLLKDFHLFFNDITINRKIKNLCQQLRNQEKYIIMSGKENKIPKDLKEYIYYIKLPLPNENEIKLEIKNFLQTTNITISYDEHIIQKAYKGFSINKIRISLLNLMENNLTMQDILNNIFKEKKKIIDQIEGLKLQYVNDNDIKLGGLRNLRQWLQTRRLAFSKQAEIYGVKIPKGILLVGIQGTGKSLSAKTIALEWKLPLIQLEVGNIFGSNLGESEERIQGIIETCEIISPCILWIDEIDKIFTQKSNSDSGTTQRVTNIFLTWLSEKKREVFIIATANTITGLPIEMLRKGRFDEIFFVDLPNFKDRMRIFQIHLKKIRPITWNRYNIYYLSKISNGFSGAEIEQSISEAMYNGFYNNREFTTRDVGTAILGMTTISNTNIRNVSRLRLWGNSGKIRIA